ncbi:protein of unknown function [Pararobbsia alpina]
MGSAYPPRDRTPFAPPALQLALNPKRCNHVRADRMSLRAASAGAASPGATPAGIAGMLVTLPAPPLLRTRGSTSTGLHRDDFSGPRHHRTLA